MEKLKKIGITGYDFFTTFIVCSFGIGEFILGGELIESSKRSSIIVTVIAASIALFMAMLILKSIKVSGYKPLPVILRENFGNLVSKIILLEFVITLILICTIQSRVHSLVIVTTLFDKTSIATIIAAFLLLLAYITRGHIDTIIRFNQIIFWITIIPITAILIYCLFKGDIYEIMPFIDFSEDAKYIRGIKEGLTAFFSLLFLYLFVPMLKNKEDSKKLILKSILVSGLYFIFLILTIIMFFGIKYSSDIIWPFLSMIKNVNQRVEFYERLEVVGIIIYLFSNIAAMANIFYFLSYMTKELFNIRSINLAISITLPIVVVLAKVNESIVAIYNFRDTITFYLVMFNIIVLPVILIIFSRVRRGTSETN